MDNVNDDEEIKYLRTFEPQLVCYLFVLLVCLLGVLRRKIPCSPAVVVVVGNDDRSGI
jgi:hypothetical protein